MRLAEMQIGEDTDIGVVCEKLSGLVMQVLDQTNNVTLRINEEKRVIEIEAEEERIIESKINTDKREFEGNRIAECTVITQNLRDEMMPEKTATYAHLVTEWAIEMWLKYQATYFYVETDIGEEGHFNFFFDKGFDKKRMNGFWNDSTYDGFSTTGKFWHREWLRGDQQRPTTGGGKLQ